MKDQTISSDLDDFLGETGKKRLPKWAKWVIGAVVLILLVVGVKSCFGGAKEINYATQPVKNGNMEVHVTATGNIKPHRPGDGRLGNFRSRSPRCWSTRTTMWCRASRSRRSTR